MKTKYIYNVEGEIIGEKSEISKAITKAMQASIDSVERRNPIKTQIKFQDLCFGEDAELVSRGQERVAEAYRDKWGVPMDVEKGVTDSMEFYKLDDSCFSDVKWVSPSIEFHFEDKKIKSIELQKGDTMKFLFASINVDDFEWDEEALATIPKTQEQLEIKKFFDLLDHDSVLQTGGEMVMYKVYLTEELGGGYVRGYVPASASYKRFAELSRQQINSSDFNNINKEQTEYKLNVLMTAFKVMAFASIPKLAPRNPFSTASSEIKRIAYMTSLKLRPVAFGLTKISSFSSSKRSFAYHFKFLSGPASSKSKRTPCGSSP